MAKPEPGTPEWWLRQLHHRLQTRRNYTTKLRAYYDGMHNLAFASDKFLVHFGGLFNAFADNWCETVVDASVERMQIIGFRHEEQVLKDAWDIWQRNDLDSTFEIANTAIHVDGESVATVWYDDFHEALVTFEPCDRAVVAVDPRNPRRRLAGLRVYLDEWGFEHAELFLPTGVYLYRSKTARNGTNYSVDAARVMWVPDTLLSYAVVDGNQATLPNPLRLVPMVQMTNKPRLWERYQDCTIGSELRPIVPLQDAVNKLVADLLVTSESSAAPLRWVSGYEPTIGPNGEPLPPPWAQPDKTWASIQSETGKFGSLDAAELKNFCDAIELLVSHIASISRTPPHYLNTSADRLSGESIKSAETGLVAKVNRKNIHRGGNAEDIIRIAGLIEGNAALSGATNLETIFSDPESRTESEHVDAVGKKRTILEIPLEQAWEDVGYTPTAIKRMKELRQEELVQAMEQAAAIAAAQNVDHTPQDPNQPSPSGQQ